MKYLKTYNENIDEDKFISVEFNNAKEAIEIYDKLINDFKFDVHRTKIELCCDILEKEEDKRKMVYSCCVQHESRTIHYKLNRIYGPCGYYKHSDILITKDEFMNELQNMINMYNGTKNLGVL